MAEEPSSKNIVTDETTSKMSNTPDYGKMLRDGMTAEELTKIAMYDGKVSQAELDNIALDAKNEGKTLKHQKVMNANVDSGKTTYSEVDGVDGMIEISKPDLPDKTGSSQTFIVDFDTSVPMTQLAQIGQAAPTPNVPTR